ncbi:hypothetical protein M8J75_000075 [Diaphorina citri]|nr:hypothetical protein M8J75_000075 [Diaphorina citri]
MNWLHRTKSSFSSNFAPVKIVLSDWLTGEFLDEQYKGQRKLAGMLSTMRKTEGTHGKLTEFLMDKEFL